MLNNLIEDLRILAESILKEEQISDVQSKLDQARSLYEKLLILDHVEKEPKLDESPAIVEEIIEPIIEPALQTLAPVENKVIEEEVKEVPKPPSIKEEEPPLSLNDLFVPTFDGIKEDMSQEAEFRDTISLDETENLFQTKKEEPRQLSLNDKLNGSSIQIGLNDRIAFVNKLFNFSQSDFNKALTKLNEFESKKDALNYFQYQVKPNYNWKGKEDLEERMTTLIERKFL